jgi:NAD(P)-dependent dehydrogenase (short-subunit alcohol dehydrogenase family)
VRGLGAQVLPLALDVACESDVERAFDETRDSLGPVDILVNSAGLALVRKVADMTLEEWSAVVGTNLTGTFLTCRAAARQMTQHGLKGRIINISSTMGKTGSAMGTAYSASKAAVIGFSQALAKELAASDIRVNTVCPGAMDTDMLRKDTLGVLAGIYNTTEEALLKSTANAIPIKRLVTPDEVARVVLFLARDDVDFLAGQALNVCGGHELH